MDTFMEQGKGRLKKLGRGLQNLLSDADLYPAPAMDRFMEEGKGQLKKLGQGLQNLLSDGELYPAPAMDRFMEQGKARLKKLGGRLQNLFSDEESDADWVGPLRGGQAAGGGDRGYSRPSSDGALRGGQAPGGSRTSERWDLSTESGWGNESSDEESVEEEGVATARETPIPTMTHEELVLARSNDERTVKIIIIFGIVLWFVIFGGLF